MFWEARLGFHTEAKSAGQDGGNNVWSVALDHPLFLMNILGLR